MQLVYSTSEMSEAQRLSQLLADAGIETHISNAHSAQMPGFSARLTPGFTGVWLLDKSNARPVHDIMLSNGFIADSKPSPVVPATKRSSLLIVFVTALVVAIAGVLLASGP